MNSCTKKHLKILVFGRSGSGKTTLINSLVNHFCNRSFDQDRLIAITQNLLVQNLINNELVPVRLPCNMEVFKDKQSDGAQSQSQSQTAKPNIYDLENGQMKLSIVDTPGLGDTGGFKVDESHTQNICQAAAALSDFNAVLFVHKASDCRKDVMLSYMIREFQGILPANCSQNFIVCFTGAPNPHKIDALAALKDMKIPVDKYFTFENDYLIPKDLWIEKTGIATSPNLQQKCKSILQKMENFWEDARDTFTDLLEHIQSLVPQPGKSLLELSIKKQVIRKLISENSDKFTEIQRRIERLEYRQKELAVVKDKLTEHEDFETTVKKLVKKTRMITKHSFKEENIAPTKITQCLVCKNLCHDPCHLDQVYSKGHINLSGCTALGGTNTCQRTSCGHSREDHMHTHLRIYEVSEDIPEEYMEMGEVIEVDSVKKEAYDKTHAEMSDIQNLVDTLENEVQTAQAELDCIYRQVAYLHTQLEHDSQHVRNEFFVEYLKYKRNHLFAQKDATQAEKDRELAFLNKAESDYESLGHIVASSPQFKLSAAEQTALTTTFGLLFDNLQETIRSYQGDRRVHREFDRSEITSQMDEEDVVSD